MIDTQYANSKTNTKTNLMREPLNIAFNPFNSIANAITVDFKGLTWTWFTRMITIL